MSTKVRLRFGGHEFPPIILFKIYLVNQGTKYYSGRKVIRPTSKVSALHGCKLRWLNLSVNRLRWNAPETRCITCIAAVTKRAVCLNAYVENVLEKIEFWYQRMGSMKLDLYFAPKTTQSASFLSCVHSISWLCILS